MITQNLALWIALVALVADALIGDPKGLWNRVAHPVTLMSGILLALEERLNCGAYQRAGGIITLIIALLICLVPPLALELVPDHLPLRVLAEIILVTILLAYGDLIVHVRAVKRALDQNLTQGQEALANIVGRDVDRLDQASVCRAAIESAAESLSDGLIAPLFWYLLLGLPGLVAYKLVNTADSLMGYRNNRYRLFGWAAARLDDVMNFLPARLTGLLLALVTPHRTARTWRAMRRDAPQHTSPNAGWPEAALAGILGLALAGPRRYGERWIQGAWMNRDGDKNAQPRDISRALSALWRSWFLIIALVTLALFIV